MIISNLREALRNELKYANEVWLAVALINVDGLDFILNSVQKDCHLHFIVGIDLPTDPRALSILLKQSVRGKTTVKILTKEFFHPKVYIIRTGRKYSAYVGSANCTNGGLEANVEMTLQTSDPKTCKELKEWFQKELCPSSEALTNNFILDYKPRYEKRISRIKQNRTEICGFKKHENKLQQAYLEDRVALKKELRNLRESDDYLEFKRARLANVKWLRNTLDYPLFQNIDFRAFLNEKELGTIDYRNITPILKENPSQVIELIKYLCSDSIPLVERIDNSLTGNKKIKYIGMAFISKILALHRPELYHVQNDVIAKSLKAFGLSFPRGLTEGEKYNHTNKLLRQIMKETKIDNFAILDLCLWTIQST